MTTDENPILMDDPCWFTKPGALITASDELKRQRDERMEIGRYGYRSDTSLKEAVRIFNEEMKCDPLQKEYPPLTEDEVLASIVEGVNQNHRSSVFRAERDIFWQIAVQRILPSGTVLNAQVGGNMSGSPLAPKGMVRTKGIEIYLQLRADKNGRGGMPPLAEPQELLIIRKTFFQVKIDP
jgi:hypothetical protein